MIDLDGREGLWRVRDVSINFDESDTTHVGSTNEWCSYQASVKDAKRWALLKIRHKGRRDTEEQILWKIDPPEPGTGG